MEEKKSNMYGFIEDTINPLAGECMHKCSYCYVEALKSRSEVIKAKYSGEPRLAPNAFKKKFKDDYLYFVCSCNDLFAKNVPKEIIGEVLTRLSLKKGRFLFQTKNPLRFLGFTLPENSIACVTLETNRFYIDNIGNAPYPQIRSAHFANIIFPDSIEKQVTIEPIMDFDPEKFLPLIIACNPSQINIGADSKNSNLPEPSKEKVLTFIETLEFIGYKVHLKSNIKRIIG